MNSARRPLPRVPPGPILRTSPPGTAEWVQVGDPALVRTSHGVWRLAPVLAALCLVAGCGAAPPVPIPSASPSPSASPTTIAPGVRVPGSNVQPPTYTVSTTHPLPSGVSAAAVAQDVVIDNLIENVAIERDDPALLAYADCGNWLAAEEATISKNRAASVTVLSIRDEISSMELGFQRDPNDPSVTAAVTITGVEVEVSRSGRGTPTTATSSFDVLQWLSLSNSARRYLTCDSASL